MGVAECLHTVFAQYLPVEQFTALFLLLILSNHVSVCQRYKNCLVVVIIWHANCQILVIALYPFISK